jgi:hypothetical protein
VGVQILHSPSGVLLGSAASDPEERGYFILKIRTLNPPTTMRMLGDIRTGY